MEIGTIDSEDPDAAPGNVDLGAAKEGGPGLPDNAAIRGSYLDLGDEGGGSVSEIERKIADSAEVAADGPLHPDEQAALDAAVEESVGGGRTELRSEDFLIDDADGGGGGPVQLGMLDAGGTAMAPGHIAAENALLVFSAFLHGFSSDEQSPPGLSLRLAPLIEYDEVDASRISAMVARFRGCIKKLQSEPLQTSS